ncbi:MAG: sulfatase [Verrucomicrobiota bacterium]|nr:sulfatase [Verrucomicrobiota bacterium]
MIRSWVFILFWLVASSAQTAQRPNLVLILADDLGWADLSCYGNDLHQTPNLDRLARQGVRFTDAYAASPVCTPTRAAILTGLHPARLHMTIWRESALNRGNRKLLQPVCLDSLPLKHVTLAEVLKKAGYFNAHLGKWHVGRAEAYPQAHGFHVNIGGTLWGAPQTFWYPFNGDDYFRDWRYVPGLEPGNKGDYLTDRLTDKALGIMEKQTKASRSFYLNLWYHSVHTPIEGKPELVEHYRKKIKPGSVRKNPHYAAMVHSLDENVGRVLAKIDELGVADNTWVIFTSDNGGFTNKCKLNRDLAVANNAPLRSGKGSCYEGGVRVPLIVRDPQVAQGKISSEPVYAPDLYPTLLRAAGLSDQAQAGIDGVDFTPLLQNPDATLKREALYFHYPHYYQTTTPVSALRKGDWKLLEYYEDNRLELFNLKQDPGETQDISTANPDLVRRLRMELDVWRKKVGAQLPEPNPNWKSRRK